MAWAAFCARSVRDTRHPARRDAGSTLTARARGIEAAARQARLRVFASTRRRRVLALAHHRDDQAETVLLQLLRGAGPHGLAAMPRVRAGRVALVRPLLALERSTLQAYNAGTRRAVDRGREQRRRRLCAGTSCERRIAPLLARRFPGYPATLERAARHQAEAAHLLDELAAIDAGR